jgi:hypothetical protein
MEVKMQINKLELKNIKYFASGSEETPCYNANIFINGKKAIHVSNHGYGACDDHYPFKPFTYKDVKDLEKYLAKLEDDDFEPIDSWCHDRLYEYLDFKKLKRDFKTKFVCVDVEKNELYAYEKKGHSDLAFQKFMDKNHPNDTCLNFLELDLAFKFFNGATS